MKCSKTKVDGQINLWDRFYATQQFIKDRMSLNSIYVYESDLWVSISVSASGELHL